jgi:hypothetical protein
MENWKEESLKRLNEKWGELHSFSQKLVKAFEDSESSWRNLISSNKEEFEKLVSLKAETPRKARNRLGNAWCYYTTKNKDKFVMSLKATPHKIIPIWLRDYEGNKLDFASQLAVIQKNVKEFLDELR